LSAAERESIKAKDGNRCSCCGGTFPSNELVLDHLIPFSLRGADASANLVAMSKSHNSRKWDRLVRDDIKYYRGERITQRIGVRFIDGAFWPVVNGRLRRGHSAA
jgi:5-methylcytosine-specific restriction endonuclease McrA